MDYLGLVNNSDEFKTKLLEIGLNPSQIFAVLNLVAEQTFPANEKLLARQAADRARQKKRYHRKRAETSREEIETSREPHVRKKDEQNQCSPHVSNDVCVNYSKKESKKHTNGHAHVSIEFEKFWELWPHKVHRKKAIIAFEKATKTANLDTILVGVQAYISNKPESQNWSHAATWLNGERWNDKYSPKSEPKQKWLFGVPGLT